MSNFLYTKKTTLTQQSLPVEVSPQLDDELGKGLKAPVLMANNSKWWTSEGTDKVKQNIAVLLATPVGRRFLRPDYGSMLPYYLFQGININLIKTVQTQVQTAIEKFIEDVSLVEVNVSPITNANAMAIRISYNISGTKARQTMGVGLGQSQDLETLPPEFFRIDGKPLFRN